MEQGTAVSAIPCFKPLVLLSLALPQKNGVLRRLGELPLLHLEQGVVIPGEVVDRLNLPVHLERLPLLGVQKESVPDGYVSGFPVGNQTRFDGLGVLQKYRVPPLSGAAESPDGRVAPICYRIFLLRSKNKNSRRKTDASRRTVLSTYCVTPSG